MPRIPRRAYHQRRRKTSAENEIYWQFPDLRGAGKQALKSVAETLNVRLRRRKRKPMTPAQKKA